MLQARISVKYSTLRQKNIDIHTHNELENKKYSIIIDKSKIQKFNSFLILKKKLIN